MSVLTSLLNQDYAHYHRQRADDGQGGWTISYTLAGTVRGRLRPVSSSAFSVEREIAQQEQRSVTHVFYCLATETIVRGDRLTLGNLTVEVEAVREPSQADHHLEISCRERQFEVST